MRPLPLLATLALLVGAASPLAAQQDPLAAPDTRLSGVWKLDPSRSDSIPAAFRAPAGRGGAPGGAPPQGAAGGDAGGGAVVGAGGGGGGRGGGGRGGGGRGGGGGGMRSGRGAGPADQGAMGDLLAELAPETMKLEVADGQTAITNGLDDAMDWKTDKKTRQVALDKGGTIDVEASWWTKVLQTVRTVDKNNELKREFKLVENGEALEVKVSGKVNGKKGDFKLRYVRAQ